MLAPVCEPAQARRAAAAARTADVTGASPAARLRHAGRSRGLRRAWLALALLALLVALAAEALNTGRSPHAAASSRALAPELMLALPARAQAPVSAALGARDPAYAIAARRGGFAAENGEQRMRVRFTGSLASVSSGSLTVGLQLSALGYAGALRAAGPARANASRNELRVSHAAVAQWYRNGPLGLEQGFTLRRPPAGASGSVLELELALSGDARVALAPGDRSATLVHARSALRYGGLAASDARGRSLPAWLALAPGRLVLNVDVRGASYPIQIDPLLAQQKLAPAPGSLKIHLGRSVALSADGNTALVGAPRQTGEIGTAYVFTRSGTTWSEQAVLKPTGGGAREFFGHAVALSADGSVALIGDPGAKGKAGNVLVFSHTASGWSPQAELTGGAEEEGEGRFGNSVALSDDGSTALVGGQGISETAGAAWVFAHSGTEWHQQGKVLAPSGEVGGARFGWSVALSGDGSTALLGDPADNAWRGAAWVFTHSGEGWVQQGTKLTGHEETAQGEFGTAVALSDSGETALIGAPHDGEGIGAAWVFQRTGETWARQGGQLSSGQAAPAYFGGSVALSSDGRTALVGAPRYNGETGAAWQFADEGGRWTPQAKLLAPEEIGAGEFGWSVALSSEATTALIGGIGDDEGVGAAWVFAAEHASGGGGGKGEEPEPGEPGSGPPSGGTSTTSTTTSGNQGSTGTGGVQSFHAAAKPTLQAPVLGESGNIAQESGIVLLELPGSGRFVALKGSAHIPFGTIVDATHGVATVTVVGPHGELETAHYFGGRFLLTQQSNGVVLATLEGGSRASCKKNAKHASASRTPVGRAARSKRPLRKLWTNAHGSFTTKGTYAAGAVQGTEWLTEDFCEGTLVVVTRDRVKVTDLVRHTSRIVRAGKREFVKA